MITVYEAILKAADHIERIPEDYLFSSVDIPDACGTPGFALGWIGHYLSVTEEQAIKESHSSKTVLHIANHYLHTPATCHADDANEFYRRMTEISDEANAWKFSAQVCADALRLYAEKYHAPAPGHGIDCECGLCETVRS